MLETEMKDRSVLDMGCGTGILAIVAAKMEAARVVAIDNYLVACENAAGNMGRNGLTGGVVRHGDAGLLGDETFDVILANITRNVLLEDMKTYKSVLNPGGMMFLSGFLEFDSQAIIRHAASLGLVPAGEKKLADWMGLKLIEA
jgi:ribosomal protein L11 methyltransferase